MKQRKPSTRQTIVVGWSLIAFHLALTAYAGFVHTPVVDEIAYLPAGISHWQFADFRLYRANPPLVRMIATLPAITAGYEEDWQKYTSEVGTRSEFSLGASFFRKNKDWGLWLVTLGRWVCLPFTLLGALVCWRWSTELYGRLGGLLSLTLWCLCPNVTGNAALLTPDIANTSLSLAALYAYSRWSVNGSWGWTCCLGVVVGLAMLTKFNSLLLPLLLSSVFGIQWVLAWPRPLGSSASVVRLSMAFFVTCVVVNSCYGFEGSFRTLGSFQFISNALSGRKSDPRMKFEDKTGNRFLGTPLRHIPLPLPEQFVLGIDVQKAEFDRAKPAYLFGTWRNGGWWYYYLVCLLLKVPCGLFPILLLSCALSPSKLIRTMRRNWLLLVFLAMSLIFISSNTGVNRHFRYVLPVLASCYVWAGSVVSRPRSRWLANWTVAICLVWFGASSVYTFPHCQSYFNELAGGWRGGPRYLLGSNVEWGQDLLFLKTWISHNAHKRPVFIEWPSTYIHPSVMGIQIDVPPQTHSPGWYVIPFKSLYKQNGVYASFRERKPVDYIAHSMAVYHIEDSESKEQTLDHRP